MAKNITRPNSKVSHMLRLFGLFMLMHKISAYEFKVGGSSGWTVPSDPNAYNQWAEKNRFSIGDSLLFVYQPETDSVLRVNKDDYTNCNIATYTNTYKDGHTVFKFNQSGPYYFISGVKDNCLKGEKLVVVVLADRSNKNASSGSEAPSPPPSGSTETTAPSPAPAGEESPSPPAGVEINPTPAPASEENQHKNGASSLFMSFVGSLAAFVGSALLMIF
ncbi:Phytocyanin domain [Dillenia turbinata]|uniref:Phytocyanin domain n=1 Tax=Dillenia turbinata TaxID=194707 RepID=A0AAN8W7W3_9MAGN